MPPDLTKSPFFRPSDRRKQQQYRTTTTTTPRRRKLVVNTTTNETTQEHKSTIEGCTANIINAIVGAGIVGLPYAIQQTGFVAGIILIVLCGFITEKSLRLLVETAKHVHVPTYETVCEAAFGPIGFVFVALNMFIMAYGAMLTYLMIVKDTFGVVFGISSDDYPMQRAILFVISITIMVPLSSQRDVADLAKTSRINVLFDITMVLLVLYVAPIQEGWTHLDISTNIVHYDTIFVGLGVLSFAFVCQHSAFIIAGSLEQPTKTRWQQVTQTSLSVCVFLALLCGIGGYIGYQDKTKGDILNNLDDSWQANLARTLLGITMLFVYPMESFVARHVCVVLFFQGRSAHEGDDTSVLNRRDRRITLTFLLYLSALIPALIFEDVGIVLAAIGAIGGSCLSYVGPGAVYLGIHGARFLELTKAIFGRPTDTNHHHHHHHHHDEFVTNGGSRQSSSISISTVTMTAAATTDVEEEETEPLYSEPISARIIEKQPSDEPESWIIRKMKDVVFHLLLMPIWCKVAATGKSYLTSHVTELALQTPHPIRIGNVRFAPAKTRWGTTRVVMLPRKQSSVLGGGKGGGTQDTSTTSSSSGVPITTTLLRADSLPKGYATARHSDGQILALPPTPENIKILPQTNFDTTNTRTTVNYQSINNQGGGGGGAMAIRRAKEEEFALEDDPQQIPPGILDFVIAISYIIFGIIAMVAGLYSIFKADRALALENPING